MRENLKYDLARAIKAGRIDRVEALIAEIKTQINIDEIRYVGGLTPLHLAVQYSENKIAATLMVVGASVNALTDFKNTPMHIAAYYGNAVGIGILHDAGASVNVQNQGDITPLFAAAQKDYTQCVVKLVKIGADENISNRYGVIPAEIEGLLSSTLFSLNSSLRKRGAKHIESLSAELCMAIEKEKNAEIESALEKIKLAGVGINNIKSAVGLPLIIVVVLEGNFEFLERIIKMGVNVDAKDPIYCKTALHYAVSEETLGANQYKIAELLISNNADINACDRDGKAPMDYAGSDNVKLLLSAHGAVKSDDLQESAGMWR